MANILHTARIGISTCGSILPGCFLSARRLAAAQVELDAVMATLKEKQDSLAAVEEKVKLYN